MNVRHWPLIALALLAGACADNRSRDQAEQLAGETIVKLTIEREHYAAAAARAQKLLLDQHKRELDAYSRGVRDGHLQVRCLPSWPTVETKRTPAGELLSVPVRTSPAAAAPAPSSGSR